MNFWFSIIFSLIYLNPTHAFYVSVTDLVYEVDNDALKIQVKIFTNDLEDEIRNYSGDPINLQDGISIVEETRVYSYISNKIALSGDDKSILMIKESCKVEGDAVFTLFQAELKEIPNKLSIKNELLLDLFPTQTNIIRLKNGQNQKMLKLNKSAKLGEFSF